MLVGLEVLAFTVAVGQVFVALLGTDGLLHDHPHCLGGSWNSDGGFFDASTSASALVSLDIMAVCCVCRDHTWGDQRAVVVTCFNSFFISGLAVVRWQGDGGSLCLCDGSKRC